MKFSIIIPIYNCANTLGRTINSILIQTYSDFELIMIDDGSNDGSLELLREFEKEDDRIIVITQDNKGSGEARNRGILQACGDYLIFCDADDYYEPDALENFTIAAGNERPDLIVTSYREFCYKENKHSLKKISEKRKGIQNSYRKENDLTYMVTNEHHATECSVSNAAVFRQYIVLYKERLILTPWAKAYRKEVIDKNGICFPDYRRSQDVFFNLFFYSAIESLKVKDVITYNYFLPDKNVTFRKYPKDMFEIYKTMCGRIESGLRKWGVWETDVEQYMYARFIRYSMFLLRLNLVNNWGFDKDGKKKFADKIINDEMLNAIVSKPNQGSAENLIRILLKKKNTALINLVNGLILIYEMR